MLCAPHTIPPATCNVLLWVVDCAVLYGVSLLGSLVCCVVLSCGVGGVVLVVV